MEGERQLQDDVLGVSYDPMRGSIRTTNITTIKARAEPSPERVRAIE